MQYRWLSAAQSHRGNARGLNEDACLNLPSEGVWAVADGMGGHSAGEVASQAVVEALSAGPVGGSLEERMAEVSQRLEQCNHALFLEARDRGGSIIGSTVVVLISVDSRAACLWAGDSRAYCLRDGRLNQITEDHSRVQELIAGGIVKIEDARDHPQANVVTRAVGASRRLQLGTVTLDIRPRDTFLLCSDGLTDELTDLEIASLLNGNDSQWSVDALIDAVLAGEARDNVSVVVAQAHDDSPTEFRSHGLPARLSETDDETIVR